MKIELSESQLKALQEIFRFATKHITIDDEPELENLAEKIFE